MPEFPFTLQNCTHGLQAYPLQTTHSITQTHIHTQSSPTTNHLLHHTNTHTHTKLTHYKPLTQSHKHTYTHKAHPLQSTHSITQTHIHTQSSPTTNHSLHHTNTHTHTKLTHYKALTPSHKHTSWLYTLQTTNTTFGLTTEIHTLFLVSIHLAEWVGLARPYIYTAYDYRGGTLGKSQNMLLFAWKVQLLTRHFIKLDPT